MFYVCWLRGDRIPALAGLKEHKFNTLDEGCADEGRYGIHSEGGYSRSGRVVNEEEMGLAGGVLASCFINTTLKSHDLLQVQ